MVKLIEINENNEENLFKDEEQEELPVIEDSEEEQTVSKKVILEKSLISIILLSSLFSTIVATIFFSFLVKRILSIAFSILFICLLFTCLPKIAILWAFLSLVYVSSKFCDELLDFLLKREETILIK